MMRKVMLCGLVWLGAGCASRSSAGEAAPELVGVPAPVAAPQPRRETADSTVWRTPFAVQHLGDRPQRQRRPRVVQVERPPDTQAVAVAPPPPAEQAPVAEAAPEPPVTAPPAAAPRRAAARPPAPRPSRPPAQRAATPPPARPRGATLTHLVVKGDTLYSISRRYRISVERLREINNLGDDTIQLGQTLTIPVT